MKNPKVTTGVVLDILTKGPEKFLADSKGQHYSFMHNVFCYTIEVPRKKAQERIKRCEALQKLMGREEVLQSADAKHYSVRTKALRLLRKVIENSKTAQYQSEEDVATYRYITGGATTDEEFITAAGRFFGEDRIKEALGTAKEKNLFMLPSNHRREAILQILDAEMTRESLPLMELHSSPGLS